MRGRAGWKNIVFPNLESFLLFFYYPAKTIPVISYFDLTDEVFRNAAFVPCKIPHGGA